MICNFFYTRYLNYWWRLEFNKHIQLTNNLNLKSSTFAFVIAALIEDTRVYSVIVSNRISHKLWTLFTYQKQYIRVLVEYVDSMTYENGRCINAFAFAIGGVGLTHCGITSTFEKKNYCFSSTHAPICKWCFGVSILSLWSLSTLASWFRECVWIIV